MDHTKDNNIGIIETTKNLLFEKAKSAMKSYDSAQDSLDKAYLTIMFGNIAFYATKIKPPIENVYVDLVSMLYMALALIFILISFMLSKSTMNLLYNNTLLQIEILELDNPTKDKIDQSERNITKIDRLTGQIEHLNWQIPLMVIFSSSLCFIKVVFPEITQLMLMKYFLVVWIIGGTIVYKIVKEKQNGKT